MYAVTSKVGANIAVFDSSDCTVEWVTPEVLISYLKQGVAIQGAAIDPRIKGVVVNPIVVQADFRKYKNGESDIFGKAKAIFMRGSNIEIVTKKKRHKGIVIREDLQTIEIRMNTGVQLTVPKSIILPLL